MGFFNRRNNVKTVRKLFPGPGTFAHGVHPPRRKELAADAPIEIIPPSEKVILPLQQHIGGSCTPIVKPKQKVAFGTIVVGCREVISFTQEHFRGRFSEKIIKSLDNMAVWVVS